MEKKIDELSSKLGEALTSIKKKDESIMELQGKARDLKKLVVSHQHEADLKQQQLSAKVGSW